MREIVLDTETTGLDYRNGDRIIEVACVELNNYVATGGYIQFYCSTSRIISKEAESIHGLSNSFLDKFQNFKEQAKKLTNFIQNDTLIIHNAEFDIGFINNELKIANLQTIKNNFIDTVLLARKTLNTRTANLDYLCRRFSIDRSARKFHGALLDCQLLSEVYLELRGGTQTTLNLHNTSKKNIEKEKKPTNRQQAHKTIANEEEVEQHKKMTLKLNNPLWKQTNY